MNGSLFINVYGKNDKPFQKGLSGKIILQLMKFNANFPHAQIYQLTKIK